MTTQSSRTANRSVFRWAVYGLLFTWVVNLAGCLQTPDETLPSDRSEALTLNVALYRYVPDLEFIQAVVTEAWAADPTAPTLNFIDWDCYHNDPPADLDVFVFDGIVLSHFAAGKFVRPLQPQELEGYADYLAYAVNGCRFEGELLCNATDRLHQHPLFPTRRHTCRGLQHTHATIRRPGQGNILN